MTPETKAWIEEVKKRDTYISLRFIEIDDYHKAHADRRELLKVIESQEKEIERLKGNLHEAQERWRNVLHVLPDQNDIPSNLLEALHDFTKK